MLALRGGFGCDGFRGWAEAEPKVGVDYGAAIEGPCGGADGWRYVDADFEVIELGGAACTGARVVGEVDATYYCGPSSG